MHPTTKKKSRRSELCFLCSKPIAKSDWTSDHFFGRLLYPNHKLPNRSDLCLPAHRECNASSHEDETYAFRIWTVSSPTRRQSIGDRERWSRVMRGLEIDVPSRVSFLEGAREVAPGLAMYRVDRDRLVPVLARMAKGLYMRTVKAPLPATGFWWARQKAIDTFVASSLPNSDGVEGTWHAKWIALPGVGVGCELAIFGEHFMSISNLLPPNDAVELTWPLPRRSTAASPAPGFP